MIQEKSAFGERTVNLHWSLPLALALLTALYPFGPAAWIHTNFHSPFIRAPGSFSVRPLGPLVHLDRWSVIGRSCESDIGLTRKNAVSNQTGRKNLERLEGSHF